MNATKIKTIQDRLSNYAASNDDAPPAAILAQDGGPSGALMAFCDKHHLTLDWAILGATPQYRRHKRPLNELTDDAVFLHGLLQGLDLLIGEAAVSAPASNAAYVLSQEVVKKCRRLVDDMEKLTVRTAGRETQG